MAFTTITEEQQEAMGVTGLPDTPLLDTHDMQVKLDELGNAAIDWIQTFVQELEAPTAPLSIGCTPPAGVVAAENTLQSVLIAIARYAVNANEKAHSHTNKAVLDGISATLKGKYDNLANLIGNITAFDSEGLIPSTLSIPSSQAVALYVQAFDIAGKLLTKAYPVGSCYIGPSSPSTFLGGTWTEVTDTGLSSDYTVWKRIS